MSEKLTDWFSGDQKPTLIGVYERKIPRLSNGALYSYWNGSRWGMCTRSIRRAIAKSNADYASLYQTEPWRGLAENPEK